MNLSVQGKPVIQCLKSASCIPANRKIYLVATVALSGLIALLIVGYGMHRSVNRLDATESAPLSKSDDGQDLGELGGTPALASSSGDEPVDGPQGEVSSSGPGASSIPLGSDEHPDATESAPLSDDGQDLRELSETPTLTSSSGDEPVDGPQGEVSSSGPGASSIPLGSDEHPDATESAPLSDNGQDLGELGGTRTLASSSGDEPVESLESEEKSPHLEVSSSPESVCASSPKMTQALHSAIRTGDQGRVRELIEQGADVNALGKKGAALHVAVFSAMDTLPLTKCLSVWKTGLPKWKAKWFAIVNELVQRGADPSIKNESNQTVRESINDPLFDSPYCFYTSSSKKLSDLSNGRKLVHEILDDAEACLINPRFRMFLLCANAHEQTGGPLGMLPVELVCIIKNQMGIKNVLRNYRPASARDECA